MVLFRRARLRQLSFFLLLVATEADLSFKVFTRDPQGYASHIRTFDTQGHPRAQVWTKTVSWPSPKPRDLRFGGWLSDRVLFRWIQWALCTSWCNPHSSHQPNRSRWGSESFSAACHVTPRTSQAAMWRVAVVSRASASDFSIRRWALPAFFRFCQNTVRKKTPRFSGAIN